MGSYITIVNDTDTVFFCKMKLHRSAAWFGLAAGGAVLGGLAALAIPASIGVRVAGTLGVGIASPVMAHSVLAYFKPESQILKVQAGASYMDRFTNYSVSAIERDLMANKFERIDANGSHRYGRMALSMVREADCMNVNLESTTTMKMSLFTMHALWSSGRAGREHRYSIKSSLVKYPGKLYTIFAGSSISPSGVETATNKTAFDGSISNPGEVYGQSGAVIGQPVSETRTENGDAGSNLIFPSSPSTSTAARTTRPTLHSVDPRTNQALSVSPPVVFPINDSTTSLVNVLPVDKTPASIPPVDTNTPGTAAPPSSAVSLPNVPISDNQPEVSLTSTIPPASSLSPSLSLDSSKPFNSTAF
ncbi:unnamed protein product [Albugo candida]|uniref:Uncharacterized protein n=1 Tax=Albugo candida TaxID=65357 RepID=A0A024FT61_9STRA|nr:unnamed protein product [Albugo candida]|eukprot:CCI10062.1 unnamed protein product [Albugo candida]